jgi:hypothetical protein
MVCGCEETEKRRSEGFLRGGKGKGLPGLLGLRSPLRRALCAQTVPRAGG